MVNENHNVNNHKIMITIIIITIIKIIIKTIIIIIVVIFIIKIDCRCKTDERTINFNLSAGSKQSEKKKDSAGFYTQFCFCFLNFFKKFNSFFLLERHV